MGETIKKVKDRLTQHSRSIQLKQIHLLVPRHVVEKEHKESDLKCMVLEEIPSLRRGEDRILEIGKRVP